MQLERTIQSDAWGGASGENIRSYLQEVHVEGLLPMLSDLLYDYVAKLALYDYGYSRIDGDIHKKFNEDAIREAEGRYRTEQLEECREAFGEVLCSIGDILETVSPTIRDIENDCGRIRYRLEHLMHEISEHEERAKSEWTGPLGELAGALSQAVRAAISRPTGGVAGYRPWDAWNISGMQEAYLRCVSAESGWRADSGLLGEAAAYEMSVTKKLREEDEAQQAEEKKKKQENAVGEMLGSGLMLLGGAAAVVCSAGTATPLVASCFLGVSGSTVMAFGLSDAMESTVEYATGREDACNPLRGLAFLGNEEVYRSVEMAAVMTAGFGGSMSASVSVEGVITKSGFARIVAGEAAGIMTSVGIEEVGSRAGLSETERLLLNLGAGMAIGKLTERMPGRRKAGGSEGGSSRVYEENFKKNVAAAREDLDIRTRNAVEKNWIWIGEGGSGTIPHDIESRLDSLVDDIRADVGKDFPTGNVGAAVTDIDGVTNDIKAYSKYNNSISGSNLNHEYSYNFGKENRIFDTKAVNNDNIVDGPNAFNRAVDSESKILEDIAHQLGYNKFTVDETVQGNVYLVTERSPCPSCTSVIEQFEKMFPNVKVHVKYKY